MIATLFQLKYLRSESRLGVSLVSIANVRMKVGYNFLYETSELLHICEVKEEQLKTCVKGGIAIFRCSMYLPFSIKRITEMVTSIK